MGKVSFRSIQPGDIEHIADNLREADVQELRASKGEDRSLRGILTRAVALSTHLWVTVADDGEPVAIYGVAPISLLEGIGSPWFVSTDRAYEYPRTLIVEGKRYLAEMQSAYSHLVNYVDARNDKSIRWLRRLGFTVHAAKPYGLNGEPFHKFEKKRA